MTEDRDGLDLVQHEFEFLQQLDSLILEGIPLALECEAIVGCPAYGFNSRKKDSDPLDGLHRFLDFCQVVELPEPEGKAFPCSGLGGVWVFIAAVFSISA